jgi:ATP/maltotriose-dependent transcriptional regulator MalT
VGTAWALLQPAGLALERGDLTTARTLFEESAALFRRHGDQPGLAWPLACLGPILATQGEIDAGLEAVDESVALFRARGDRRGLVVALMSRAGVASTAGDAAAARAAFRETIPLLRALGSVPDVAWVLEGCAGLAANEGRPADAARLAGAAAALRQTVGVAFGLPGHLTLAERRLAQARQTLGEAAFAAAWTEGRALAPDEAAALAMVEEETSATR